ncbi:MAG: AmmeMemoRadiSam system protein B [Treponema sp.]|nr:AmmeMemoRadiSam system protein B [Treponema sp.]
MRKMAYSPKSRVPVVNGLFYPDDKELLCAQIQSWGLIEGSQGRAKALIAPHGAWSLTGRIAGEAFSFAAGRRDAPDEVRRVLLLGPIHRGSFRDLYITESDYFETPLGRIPTDRELCSEIASTSMFFEVNDIPHLIEHSIEVLLPLVKYFFPTSYVVPILVGGSRQALVGSLARSLAMTLENRMDETLIVISSNMSNNTDAGVSASQKDRLLCFLDAKNGRSIEDDFRKKEISACGCPIMASVLESGLLDGTVLIKGAASTGIGEKGEIIHYAALSFR